MDMLPARKAAPLSVSPRSRQQSWNDGPNPMLDSSTVVEVEANNPRKPELDAEAPGSHVLEMESQIPFAQLDADAPGPHKLEIETLEPVLEMESQRPLAELEGRSRPWLTGRHETTMS